MDQVHGEFFWPGFPDAIPVILIGLVLPGWLIYLLFRYTQFRLAWKLLLIPVGMISPFTVSLLWPLIIKLSGIVGFTGPGDYDAPYTWYATELFGSFSDYVWVALTAIAILILHRIAKFVWAKRAAELDARIASLHALLRKGDSVLTPDELRAVIEKEKAKRRNLDATVLR